jgi:hypothetical protein
MKEETEDKGGSQRHPGMLAVKGAHVLGACIGVLERLRNRLQGPAEHEESSRKSAKTSPSAVNVQTAPAAAVPRQKSFLHRALILLFCLVLGAGGGTLVSYRLFSTTLASHGAVIDQMQDEIDQSKKQEALNLNAKIKYQREMNEYRKTLIEAQQEVGDLKGQVKDYKGQVEQLTNQLAATKKVERPAAKAGHATLPAPVKPIVTQKTGNCVTGTTNAIENLTNCIDKFNSK